MKPSPVVLQQVVTRNTLYEIVFMVTNKSFSKIFEVESLEAEINVNSALICLLGGKAH